MQYGLPANLTNRLSNAASAELVALNVLLRDFQLSEGPEDRILNHGASFSLKAAYAILTREETEDDHANLIWRPRAHPKLKLFGWVLYRGRLNTRANLFHKHIISDAACPRCPCTSKDTAHLFLNCPKGHQVWVQLQINPSHRFQDLWSAVAPTSLDPSVWPEVLLISSGRSGNLGTLPPSEMNTMMLCLLFETYVMTLNFGATGLGNR